MKALLIAALFLFNQTSLACKDPVTYLQEGKPATCNGYLFSPEKEKQVRELSKNYENMEELVKKQDELNDVLNNRIYVISEQNVNLRKQVDNLESQQKLDNIIYLILGVVIGITAGRTLTK